MERRTLLAIALSILVILGYQYLLAKFYPQPKVTIPSESAPIEKIEGEKVSAKAVPAVGEMPLSSLEAAIEQLSGGEEAVFATDKYKITTNNLGGVITGIKLLSDLDPKTGEPINLVSVKKPGEGIFAISGLGRVQNLERLIHQTKRTEDAIIFTYRIGNSLEIEKKIGFHKLLYSLDLYVTFRNLTDQPIEENYKIVGVSNISVADRMEQRFLAAEAKVGEKIYIDKRVKNGAVERAGITEWVALRNQYFVQVFKPLPFSQELRLTDVPAPRPADTPLSQTAEYATAAFARQLDGHNILSGVASSPFMIPPKSSVTHHYLFYAGPNELTRLNSYKIGLEETMHYGTFTGLSKWILSLTRAFNKMTKSWGVAIILMSILINIVLFPLSWQSFVSMRKMQTLQPHMEKVRKEHKDNPQKQQKEMMELYRKYKVNPFGGCLPMILQIPIFFALYQALINSFELRGAKFLWIKDLSQPDALRLPLILPVLGSSVNILPILTAVAMFGQQYFSSKKMAGAQTEQQRQQQQMMMFMMPVMFGVLFYGLPSGLFLYWLTNTLLMIANQAIVNRFIPATPA